MPVFSHFKELYILWHSRFYKFPKNSRFSIGLKIDSLFLEAIEEISLASFTQGPEKVLHVKRALSLADTLKVFLQIAWELKLIEVKHYVAISESMETVGKMLGGWYGQAYKQNSPATAREK